MSGIEAPHRNRGKPLGTVPTAQRGNCRTRAKGVNKSKLQSPLKDHPAWGIGACPAHSVSRLQFLMAVDGILSAAIILEMETHLTSSERNS